MFIFHFYCHFPNWPGGRAPASHQHLPAFSQKGPGGRAPASHQHLPAFSQRGQVAARSRRWVLWANYHPFQGARWKCMVVYLSNDASGRKCCGSTLPKSNFEVDYHPFQGARWKCMLVYLSNDASGRKMLWPNLAE